LCHIYIILSSTGFCNAEQILTPFICRQNSLPLFESFPTLSWNVVPNIYKKNADEEWIVYLYICLKIMGKESLDAHSRRSATTENWDQHNIQHLNPRNDVIYQYLHSWVDTRPVLNISDSVEKFVRWVGGETSFWININWKCAPILLAIHSDIFFCCMQLLHRTIEKVLHTQIQQELKNQWEFFWLIYITFMELIQ